MMEGLGAPSWWRRRGRWRDSRRWLWPSGIGAKTIAPEIAGWAFAWRTCDGVRAAIRNWPTRGGRHTRL